MYFNESETIQNKYCFGKQNVKTQLNVAYGTDKNFLLGCMISITSLLINNPNIRFSFHVFTDYIDNEYCKKVQILSNQYNTMITLYLVNGDAFKTFPQTKNWSHAMYFRFIAIDLICQDRLLYVDADVICNGSIQELVNIDLQTYYAAVIKDGTSDFWMERAQCFNVKEISNGYFNSGIMLINLKQCRKDELIYKAIELLSDQLIIMKLKFPDQDILNILFKGNILFLDLKYNTQTSINFELQVNKNNNYNHPISDQTIFIHYIGPTKPWHCWANYPINHYFLKIKEQSPWKNTSLLGAHSSSLLRYQAKHLFHQHHFIKGLVVYVKYFYTKIKN